MTRNPEETAFEIYKNFSKTNISIWVFSVSIEPLMLMSGHTFIISCFALFFNILHLNQAN